MQAVVARMKTEQAEREDPDARLEDEDEECPICFDCFTDPVITACCHSFCKECIRGVLDSPAPNAEDAARDTELVERPCPQCRAPVTEDTTFLRAAFEPSKSALVPMMKVQIEPSDDEEPSLAPGKSFKRKPKKLIFDDDEDDPMNDNGDDLKDFIVDDAADVDNDDDGPTHIELSSDSDSDFVDDDADDADYKPSGRSTKVRRNIVLDSDEEDLAAQDVLLGKKKGPAPSAAEIELLPKFLPSTKMKYMMEQVKKVRKTAPDEKILIVSQWTSCLALVSDYLTERGLLHVKYQGDMARKARENAVRVFMSKDKATIMLMSLKCGGVGLNLTRANHVISLDLGWSQAVEAQAFDRVHRLRQLREVLVERLVIENTVEDRILALQERKQSLADGSFGEGTGQKIGRLSVRELANLFGLDALGQRLDN